MTDPIDHLLVVALEALRIAGRPLDHLELNEEVHREHFDLDFQRRHFLRLKTRFATNLEELPDGRIQWIGDDEPMDGAMAVSDVGARSAKPRSTARTVKVSSMAPPHASAKPGRSSSTPREHPSPRREASSSPRGADATSTQPVLGPLQLLQQWVDEKPGSDERVQLTNEFDRLSDLPPLLAFAGAVLRTPTREVEWRADSDVLSLPDKVLCGLVQRAQEERQFGWALNVGLSTRSKSVLAKVAAVLQTAPSSSLANLVDDAVRRNAAGEDDSVGFRHRNLIELLSDQAGEPLRTAMLNLAAEMSGLPTERKQVRAWIEPLLALGLGRSSPEDVGRWLDSQSVGVETLSILLQQIGGLLCETETPRGRLIRSVARSSHYRLILDEAVWDLVEFEALGAILSDRQVRERFLLDGAADGSLSTIVAAKVKPLRLGRVLAETERHPFLEPFIPNRLVIDGIRSHPALKSAMAEAERELSVRFQAEHLADRQKFDEQLLAQADEWKGRTEALAADRDAALQRVAETEDRMRAQSKAHSAAIAAQLRQAQFDALRAMVDLVEELRLSAGVSEAAKAVASDGQRRLREFGITVEGQVGDRGTFDHRYFKSVGGSTSSLSEVVAPAYLIDLDSGVTPLRYGQTQSLQT